MADRELNQSLTVALRDFDNTPSTQFALKLLSLARHLEQVIVPNIIEDWAKKGTGEVLDISGSKAHDIKANQIVTMLLGADIFQAPFDHPTLLDSLDVRKGWCHQQAEERLCRFLRDFESWSDILRASTWSRSLSGNAQERNAQALYTKLGLMRLTVSDASYRRGDGHTANLQLAKAAYQHAFNLAMILSPGENLAERCDLLRVNYLIQKEGGAQVALENATGTLVQESASCWKAISPDDINRVSVALIHAACLDLAGFPDEASRVCVEATGSTSAQFNFRFRAFIDAVRYDMTGSGPHLTIWQNCIAALPRFIAEAKDDRYRLQCLREWADITLEATVVALKSGVAQSGSEQSVLNALHIMEVGRNLYWQVKRTEMLANLANEDFCMRKGLPIDVPLETGRIAHADASREHRIEDIVTRLTAHLRSANGKEIIAVVVPSIRGSFAVIIGAAILLTVPLPTTLSSTWADWSRDLRYKVSTQSAAGGSSRLSDFLAGEKGLFACLWSEVLKPIDQALSKIAGLEPSLGRVWWCMAGALSIMPIHAAAVATVCDHPDRSTYFTIETVHSYTTTLSALLSSFDSPIRLAKRPLIGILHEEKECFMDAEGTMAHRICKDADICALLLRASDLGRTMTDEFLAAHIRGAESDTAPDWIHLIGHGEQNSLESSLVLPNGQRFGLQHFLEIDNPAAAILSACSTAQGEESLPDEAIYLAGPLQHSRFASIIATLWPVDSAMMSKVIEVIYKESVVTDGRMAYLDTRKMAWALHKACLIEVERDGELTWVPIIHIGT